VERVIGGMAKIRNLVVRFVRAGGGRHEVAINGGGALKLRTVWRSTEVWSTACVAGRRSACVAEKKTVAFARRWGMQMWQVRSRGHSGSRGDEDDVNCSNSGNDKSKGEGGVVWRCH
jgi:hypothetical protein